MYKQEQGRVWVLIPCFIVEWKKGLKDNPLCSNFIHLPLTLPVLRLNAQQTGCCPMDLRFPLFLLASILGRHSPSHSCPTLGFNTSSRSHTLCVTLTPQSPETSSVNLRGISVWVLKSRETPSRTVLHSRISVWTGWEPECHQQCPSLQTQPFVAIHLQPCTGLLIHPIVLWLYHHPSLPWNNVCWADIQETAMSTSVNSTHLDKFRKLWT